jgi:hypothetical protein
MGKSILVLYFFSHTFLLGQYIPFPNNNATWVNYHYYFGGEWTTPTINVAVQIENFCVHNEDTIINSLTYTKLNYCNGDYRGALRDNGGQVFFVSNDSLHEMLLYDFTVDIGDTLTDVFFNDNWIDTLYISNITSVTIGAVVRKKIHLSLSSGGFGEMSDHWIEGVGCSAGLLVDPFLNQNISGTYARLECFSTNDSIFNPQSNFYYSGSGSCDLNYLSLNGSADAPILLFPNPTSDVITIQLPNSDEVCEIKICNTKGEVVNLTNAEINQSQIEIAFQDLPAGLYFISFKNSEMIYSTKFLKQ